MAIRRYQRDPTTNQERAGDEEALRKFERGEFLRVDPAIEQRAVEDVQRRYEARRRFVATLGKELGILRRAHGLTQEQVAHVVGTNKSNISRLESGRYGGLTVERLMAVLEAFEALGDDSRKVAETRAPGGLE